MFIVGIIGMYSSVAVDPIPSTVSDEVYRILASNSIDSSFPSDGNIQLLAFLVSSIIPAISALLYILNIKFSDILFVATFAAYLASPLVFNVEGAELYSSVDIFTENLVSAIGGMLCLHIILSSDIFTRTPKDISDARA